METREKSGHMGVLSQDSLNFGFMNLLSAVEKAAKRGTQEFVRYGNVVVGQGNTDLSHSIVEFKTKS